NPSFHREVAELSAGMAGSAIGTGVELQSISRRIDELLEGAITRNVSEQNNAGAQLDRLNQLQAILAPGDGSIHGALTAFFSAAEQLSVQPDDQTQRRVFLAAANDLADRLNSATDNFNQLHADLVSQAKTAVDDINGLATQIAQLNQRIHD